jgi:hypothetical protein
MGMLAFVSAVFAKSSDSDKIFNTHQPVIDINH